MADNILITGGCGFIGISLINKLINLNPNVNIRVLDNLSIGSKKDLKQVGRYIEKEYRTLKKPSGLELIVGDIREPECVYQCTMGIDYIVHLAASTGVFQSVEKPRDDLHNNIIGTFNLLEAARIHKVARFIYASSGAVVGKNQPPIHENLVSRPVSPYGASKLGGEGYCSAYFHSFGIKTVVLRFGNVYGPGSKHKSSVIAKFIKKSLKGEVCQIYGDGSQTRDYIFIDDLIEAILKASIADAGGGIFQIATSKERTVNEVVQIIRFQLRKKLGIDMKIKHVASRVGDVQRNYSDTTKALNLLKWQAEEPFERGIVKTINYFIDQDYAENTTQTAFQMSD